MPSAQDNSKPNPPANKLHALASGPSQTATRGPRLLQAIELYKSYKGRTVVSGVSFEVKTGQVVGLLGPNGAGKTTSFYMVIGLVRSDSGQVLVDGQDISPWQMHERARRGIAYLPQEASVFRRMTVEENILAVLETLSISAQERKERLHRLLDEFSINHIAQQKAFTLSGGERRRVEVARALALNPIFLMLDEPFAGIDPIAVGDIQRMITTLRERDIGILITDHNVRETLRICDVGYLLAEGKIIEQGSPEKIASSKMAREKYLGEDFKL